MPTRCLFGQEHRVDATYGLPRHGNPDNPLDDLACILLSNRTPPARAQRLYRALKAAYPTWEDVEAAQRRDLVALLKPAGLAAKKTKQILEILLRLRKDFGDLKAAALWQKDQAFLLAYLTALPGVSDKVARCVMTYTLGHDVLPVDVHVHRIAFRLEWTARKRPEQSHEELEALIPPHRRYSFHVTSVAHGRARCRASNPRCADCPIRTYCAYYRQVYKVGKSHR